MPAADTDSIVIVRDIDSLHHRIDAWRRDHKSVALVPTMGALHKGHLTLMSRAQQMAERVVATIFVNPTQFGANEDFGGYPRRESEDFQMLASAGVHLLYAPDSKTMYPKGFATSVRVKGLSTILDGGHRRGHFNGVATVVTKLLLQAGPDIALFGEKDYQQLAIIKRLVSDLNIRTDIIGVPTVRESDGLAMSSRNEYLTRDERAQAPALYKALTTAAESIAAGGHIGSALEIAANFILDAGFTRVDYVEARHAETLAVLRNASQPGRILAAAQLGRARLIDNVAITKAS